MLLSGFRPFELPVSCAAADDSHISIDAGQVTHERGLTKPVELLLNRFLAPEWDFNLSNEADVDRDRCDVDALTQVEAMVARASRDGPAAAWHRPVLRLDRMADMVAVWNCSLMSEAALYALDFDGGDEMSAVGVSSRGLKVGV